MPLSLAMRPCECLKKGQFDFWLMVKNMNEVQLINIIQQSLNLNLLFLFNESSALK